MDLAWWFWFTLFMTVFVSVVGYLGPLLYADLVLKEQNLKKKYDAKWALVTGASSGIGRAISEKLAAMGLNVVLVALDDDLLTNTHNELVRLYGAGAAGQQFRKVGVNLGKVASENYDYLKKIAEATNDIDVQIIVNNAGYLILKGFAYTSLDAVVTNCECNVMSHVKIAHHFFTKLVERKLRGCITFTSSQTAFFPSPGGAIYGGGKAFLAAFAAGLAIEGRQAGIDVTVILPGPMRTRFYDSVPKLDVLKFFHMISNTPETVAERLLRSVGHVVVRDESIYTYATRLVSRVVDTNILVEAIAFFQPYMTDLKKVYQK